MSDFMSKVVGAASQGAVGAMVGATLSAFTEPVVNRVLVNRVPLQQAISEMDMDKAYAFLQTTMATNFIKFPFFEVINVALTFVELPGAVRGTITGMVFTTATLPLTNYRYCKSMGREVTSEALWFAYGPTVMRDIVYGIARNFMYTNLANANPWMRNSVFGNFVLMFSTVMFSCVVSAPGNELRGYYLQAPDRRKDFATFFKPVNFIRSTSVGALIMSTSLGAGSVITGPVTSLVSFFKQYFQTDGTGALLLILFFVNHFQAEKRSAAVVNAIKEEKK
jgi:hypothetical protein